MRYRGVVCPHGSLVEVGESTMERKRIAELEDEVHELKKQLAALRDHNESCDWEMRQQEFLLNKMAMTLKAHGIDHLIEPAGAAN